jgi:hypothetical protein
LGYGKGRGRLLQGRPNLRGQRGLPSIYWLREALEGGAVKLLESDERLSPQEIRKSYVYVSSRHLAGA